MSFFLSIFLSLIDATIVSNYYLFYNRFYTIFTKSLQMITTSPIFRLDCLSRGGRINIYTPPLNLAQRKFRVCYKYHSATCFNFAKFKKSAGGKLHSIGKNIYEKNLYTFCIFFTKTKDLSKSNTGATTTPNGGAILMRVPHSVSLDYCL